jgi:prepilin-type N-terminal cleavage/methylation domain-containing protein
MAGEKMKNRFSKAGFTLVEVLIAAMLIGIAIAALLASNSAFTSANAGGIHLSTAEFLIEEIRELTACLDVVDPENGTGVWGRESDETSAADYDDLDDFDGVSFSPPIDVSCAQLADFSAFTQQVTVENVFPGQFQTVVSDHGSDFVRVTVTILLNNKQIESANWIRARLN